MDTHVKEGQLYVQHQKFGKKWKKNWFVLYPASQNGIARLEFYDSPSGGGGGTVGGLGGGTNEKTRKLDKKIIRLSECISILPAVTESCPKENMAAFCVETNDKTHMFAAERNAAKDWMDTMCDIAFQQGGGGSSTSTAADSNGGAQDLQMSENLIYYSREEVNEFWVSVQRTEASERCGLAGSYWLKAENDILILKEPKTKRNVLVWPYKLLRRYGRDRVMFSFEAGRRCDSGPGNFTFETKQGNEIFTLVDQSIQSQKVLAEESQFSLPVNFDSDCPASLQHIRNANPSGAMTGSYDSSSSSSSREADGDSGGSKPGSADGVLGKREGGDGGGGGGGRGQGTAGGLKGRNLPEPPAMLGVLGGGGAPPKSPRGQVAAKGFSLADEHAGLYSEPADSVRLPLHSADSLYSDPVDSIKAQSQTSNPSPPVPTPRLRPVGDEASGGGVQGDHHLGGSNHRKPSDLYSHVYDQISLELSQKTSALSLNGAAGGGRGANSNRRPPGGKAEGASSPPALRLEHIYDEPEGCAKGGASVSTSSGMSIYDEARLEPHSQRRQGEMVAPSGSESHRHSPPQQGPSRGTPQLPAPRWSKPATAPKPGRAAFARKEPVPLPPGKHGGPGSNVKNNNNNNNIWGGGGGDGGVELYSKVSKQKSPSSNSCYNQNHQAPLRSPDIIYDNLGNV
ncbi:docking protein 1b isoform X3 [Etheostoma cragini]|uniref:docking protein 1b isoform X3 n=1 Tax=Etheostoma cragini TaxID=417921 RepID=UPI00155E06B6|nr:docking protein 1b isoform X3 [Etheostoma cragini]